MSRTKRDREAREAARLAFRPEPGTVLHYEGATYTVPESGYVPPRFRPGYEPAENVTRLNGFARRMVSSMAKRIATDGDIEVLPDLIALQQEMDEQIAAVVRSLHDDHKFSWADIAARTGTSRQAAQQRWGTKD